MIHPSSSRHRLTRATASAVQISLWGADQRARDGYNQAQRTRSSVLKMPAPPPGVLGDLEIEVLIDDRPVVSCCTSAHDEE